MIRKSIMSGAATVALTVACLGVAPSAASAAPPGGDCNYPAAVVTTTSLSVKSTAHVGSTVVAHVRVSATGSRLHPTGSVTVSVGGQSVTQSVHGSGVANLRLPSLAIGTYTVSATYSPTSCFLGSSDSATLRIVGSGGSGGNGKGHDKSDRGGGHGADKARVAKLVHELGSGKWLTRIFPFGI